MLDGVSLDQLRSFIAAGEVREMATRTVGLIGREPRSGLRRGEGTDSRSRLSCYDHDSANSRGDQGMMKVFYETGHRRDKYITTFGHPLHSTNASVPSPGLPHGAFARRAAAALSALTFVRHRA